MTGEERQAAPFEAAHWDLVPGGTALVVIDAQNDFLHPDGWYAAQGIDIGHMQRCIEPLKSLLGAARTKGIPIVWTRHGIRGVEDGGPFMQLRPFLADGGLRRETWGWEVLADLSPQPDDWYVAKTRLSAFYGTDLEVILRGLRGGDGAHDGRAHQSMRRGDVEGRNVPRLQAHRDRRVHGDDAAAPA